MLDNKVWLVVSVHQLIPKVLDGVEVRSVTKCPVQNRAKQEGMLKGRPYTFSH